MSNVHFVRRPPSHQVKVAKTRQKHKRRDHYRERRVGNLCTKCGNPKPEEDRDYVACAECREKRRLDLERKCAEEGRDPPPRRESMGGPRKKRVSVLPQKSWQRRFRLQKEGVRNSGKDWTSEEDNLFLEMLDKLVPLPEISERLGRTENALIRRATLLGREELKMDNFRSPYARARMKDW